MSIHTMVVTSSSWWKRRGLHYTILLIAFIMPVLSAQTEQAEARVVVLPYHDEEVFVHDIQKAFDHSWIANRITYQTDVNLDPAEFFYLIGIHEGQEITAQDLTRAVSYLIHKQKFKQIILECFVDQDGNRLHITLESQWTFAKLKFKGPLMDKEIYRHYYILDPGDPFDESKHMHSVKNIEERFAQEGYFAGYVVSTYIYNEATKSITVCLSLHKKQRFKIGKTALTLTVEDTVDADEKQLLEHYIKDHFLKKIAHKAYAKDLLNKVAKDIKTYLAHQGFFDISLELSHVIDRHKKRIHVTWHLDLHHRRRYFFEGNIFFSQDQLLQHILLFGRSASLVPALILAEEMSEAYHKKGFWNVQVQSHENNGAYIFSIQEGDRASLDQVIIKGAEHLDHRQLVRQCCTDIMRKRFFDADLVHKSLDAIIAHYHEAGFLNAHILDHHVIKNDDRSSYRLEIMIQEDGCHYLKAVVVEGYPDLTDSSLWADHLQKPFVWAYVQEQRQALADYFQRQGYTQVTLKSEIVTDQDHQITIRWHVECAHKKLLFDKTVIQGTSRLPYSYLMSMLPYQAGDCWDQKKIQRALVRLKELDLFQSINLYPAVHEHDEDKRMMILKLQEDDPYELRLRAGLGLQQVYQYQTFNGLTYKIGAAFLYRNPLNAGDQFRFDADVTRADREVTAQYRRPFFLTMPLVSLLQVYSVRYEQPAFLRCNKNIYTIYQNGFLLGLRHTEKNWNSGFTIGIDWMKTTINANGVLAENIARAINFTPLLIDKSVPYLFVEPTVLLDLLDDDLQPTRGSLSLFSCKGMFPLKRGTVASYLIKFLAEQSFFVPIKSVVAALRIRLGHIFHRQFNALMPIERFYLGGSQSLRSYELDYAPPLGIFTDEEGETCLAPQGGKSMININAELRIPIFKRIDLAIFQDFGALSNNHFSDFKREHLLAGTGFGFRYNTPIGPLRFDIGFKWHVIHKIEPSYAWFLTLGNAF